MVISGRLADRFRNRPVIFATLAVGWLTAVRLPSLVGPRDVAMTVRGSGFGGCTMARSRPAFDRRFRLLRVKWWARSASIENSAGRSREYRNLSDMTGSAGEFPPFYLAPGGVQASSTLHTPLRRASNGWNLIL